MSDKSELARSLVSDFPQTRTVLLQLLKKIDAERRDAHRKTWTQAPLKSQFYELPQLAKSAADILFVNDLSSPEQDHAVGVLCGLVSELEKAGLFDENQAFAEERQAAKAANL